MAGVFEVSRPKCLNGGGFWLGMFEWRGFFGFFDRINTINRIEEPEF